jgi:hypothetical protein
MSRKGMWLMGLANIHDYQLVIGCQLQVLRSAFANQQSKPIVSHNGQPVARAGWC